MHLREFCSRWRNKHKLIDSKKAYYCTTLNRQMHKWSYFINRFATGPISRLLADVRANPMCTLLRGTYIISWMRLHGLGHGVPQDRARFGTFKGAWQRGVLYSLWEKHAPQTTWAIICAKIEVFSLIGGDLCSKSVKAERKVTFILRVSKNTAIVNINTAACMSFRPGCADDF